MSKNFYFKHKYDQLEKEVLMQPEENILVQFKLTKELKLYGC